MSLNATEYGAVRDVLAETDPNKYENRADVEFQWAMKAYHHAETYDNLLKSVDPKFLKLTRIDDEIYTEFKKDFPDLKIDVLDEDAMKTPESKAEWREFFKKFEGRVEDFNMGTLIRIDSSEEFSEKNSTIDRVNSGQTVQTLIRQLLQELSDLGLHCLQNTYKVVYMSGEITVPCIGDSEEQRRVQCWTENTAQGSGRGIFMTGAGPLSPCVHRLCIKTLWPQGYETFEAASENVLKRLIGMICASSANLTNQKLENLLRLNLKSFITSDVQI